MERYLPWWIAHVRRYVNFPIAFADFGMTQSARRWCEERGVVIDLPKMPITNVCNRKWEEVYSKDVWKKREAWFQKSLACLHTPFDLTLWLDLDCEVCRPFEILDVECGLVPEQDIYNSGVIMFRRKAPFLQEWVDECRRHHFLYMGDQEALSKVVRHVTSLPSIYNWRMNEGFNHEAIIVHWAGAWGKEYLDKFGDVHRLIS